MQNSFTEATLADLAKSISCLQRPDDMAGYLHDASNAHAGGRLDMVFRPESPEQVADIVRACHKEGRALTIQGGRTGLAGGAVPDDGDVIIALERLDNVVAFEPIGGTLTVAVGMMLDKIYTTVEKKGWYFAVA